MVDYEKDRMAVQILELEAEIERLHEQIQIDNETIAEQEQEIKKLKQDLKSR